MRLSPNAKKLEERARLEDDVAAFLQAGGAITTHDHTDNKTYRDRMRKRQGSRGNPPNGLGMGRQIQHTVDGKKNVGATPDHQWRSSIKDGKRPERNTFGIMASGVTI